jgi:hypothetical protein
LAINYAQWIDEIKRSSGKYGSLFAGGKEKPPIFFFGDPKGAVAATIGVNPSSTEFEPQRGWTTQYFRPEHLLNRCNNYFCKNMYAPPHEWFNVWKNFLRHLGSSYIKPPRAIHLDFSPRATLSMSTLQNQSKQQQELFLKMIKEDLEYLIQQIRAYPSIKHLYLAGSATKKYYCIKLLEQEAKRLKFRLEPKTKFVGHGPGSYGLYILDVGDKTPRYLFFCSTSPSSRKTFGPHPLEERGKWLKKNHSEFKPNVDNTLIHQS